MVDLYTATLLRATGRSTMPQPETHKVRIYILNRQRVLVKESGEFERTREVAAHRVYPEELRESSRSDETRPVGPRLTPQRPIEGGMPYGVESTFAPIMGDYVKWATAQRRRQSAREPPGRSGRFCTSTGEPGL